MSVVQSVDGHISVRKFVKEWQNLCSPKDVHWCTGTDQEFSDLCQLLVKQGTFVQLNSETRPNSFLARTDAHDVEVDEKTIYVCTKNTTEVGPLNHWHDPTDMNAKVQSLFKDCMKGRTMYVVPFSMGPIGPHSRYGVQITDSPYVAASLKLISRIGSTVLDSMKSQDWFLPCVHSVGAPLNGNTPPAAWPCNLDKKMIALFVEDPKIVSFGSGFGNNSFISKRLFGLRFGSLLAKNEGWLAEHCLILSLTSPDGKKYYIAAGFPTGSGKTNLATMIPTIPGWTVRCVGDDIAWMHVGEDGRLYAINPEAGFFDKAVGMSYQTSPAAMETISKNTIFTNVGLTPEGDVWWEGMTKEVPKGVIDWTGKPWDGKVKVAHPNARYTTPASQCPVIDPDWENPNGVPICAIVFGGRREKLVPLVTEAFIWDHGVFMGSIISSEQTAAAEGNIGKVRRDPFSMLPFCGYNMGDYFGHWADFRKHLGFLSPKIFYVNWFRKDESGKFLWPGFGENSRVLKWICERVDGTGEAKSTPIGYVPTAEAMDLGGLDITPEVMHELLRVDANLWLQEIPDIRNFYTQFGNRLPSILHQNLTKLEQRLKLSQDMPTANKKLINWVEEVKMLCEPSKVQWCTGRDDEFEEICDLLVKQGTFQRLKHDIRPSSFVCRTDARDTGRIEEHTYVCTEKKEDSGAHNQWENPKVMKEKLNTLFKGCMKGRTMYIVPFCMGPLGSKYSKYGVEITDSPYVVANMRQITRMGTAVLNVIGNEEWFLPCLHSVGKPLQSGEKDVAWPCNPENTIVALFPDELSVMSFGSGFGANSLMSKRNYGLRMASAMAKKEGWLAEHCLVLGLTSPEGKKYYIAAGFPTGSGKTNLATMIPTIPGWTVRCVGDDIAWMHVGEDGRLYAINPEAGFFDRITGVNAAVSPATMATLKKNTIFTNVGLTPEGDVWWEGMTKEVPKGVIDWTGKPWDGKSTVAHPNARYTAPASQCPVIDPEWENPNGVPLHAIVFGGRRFSTYPLVTEAFTWEHGVFLGSLVAADRSEQAVTVRESFAMIPYNTFPMKEYFNKWIDLRKQMGFSSPKIFFVNWFRTNNGKADGKMLWPGFGDNIRVLKWICARSSKNNINTGKVVKTPLGFVPADLDTKGLNVPQEQLGALLKFDSDEWKKEEAEIKKYYETIGVSDVFSSTLADMHK